jgi:pre-mRNA-processing factor SLU7
MKVTVRNLRLREDTPKYLRNLDLNSAFYDPKTRSMRMNPLPDENPEDLVYAGDNFVRHTGDALAMAATQVLCWEMQARGESVDVISNPSQAEMMRKQFVEKKKVLADEKRAAIYDKYGISGDSAPGAIDAGADPRLRFGQTETYVEYSSDGRVIKGSGAGSTVVKRTKYEEDVFINNHTSVWGSFFSKARMSWGFSCCHSLTKNSYCTGNKGREANDAVLGNVIDPLQARKMLESTNKSSNNQQITKRSDLFGEFDSKSSVPLDDSKVKLAMKKQLEIEKNNAQSNQTEPNEKKRAYNSMQAVDVSLEDMEAYRMRKVKRDDPMAQFLHSDKVLDYK